MSVAVAEFRDPIAQRGFTQLENAVLFDTRLTPGARLVYGALKHFAWKGGGEVPAQPELAKALGMSERSLRSHLKELVGLAMVTMQRRRSKPNLYVIEPYTSVQANIAGTDQADFAGSIRQILPEPSIKTCKTEASNEASAASDVSDVKPTPPAKTVIALMFEAFEAEVGRKPLTSSERGKWARGFRELAEAGVLPEHLSGICKEYRRKFADAELNPRALAVNLSAVAHRAKPPRDSQADRVRRIMEERGIA